MNEQLNTPPHRQVIECIESWHDENGNWYRIYSDGFIEQGGGIPGSTSGTTGTVTFNKPFSDTNYTLIQATRNNASSHNINTNKNSNDSFTWYKSDKRVGGSWYACGW